MVFVVINSPKQDGVPALTSSSENAAAEGLSWPGCPDNHVIPLLSLALHPRKPWEPLSKLWLRACKCRMFTCMLLYRTATVFNKRRGITTTDVQLQRLVIVVCYTFLLSSWNPHQQSIIALDFFLKLGNSFVFIELNNKFLIFLVELYSYMAVLLKYTVGSFACMSWHHHIS